MNLRKYIWLPILLLLTACEVSYGLIDGSIDADTFSVDIFEEQAPNAPAGYGANYTDFLKDFVLSRTKLKLTNNDADISISGKIIFYDTSPISVQADNQASLNSLTVRIAVTVINNKNPEESFEANFSQFSNYSSSQDLSVVESELLEDINTKLSQDIVNRLTSNW